MLSTQHPQASASLIKTHMERGKRHCSHHLLVSLLFCLWFSISVSQSPTINTPVNGTVSSLLVFGDSTVDPGNNNYVPTAFRSNFPPYGKDFKDHFPTGRFSNGRLTTDFIISYAGIKESVPAYLDPNLSIKDLLTGVSFASAGSGFDPLTPTLSGVISIKTQLEYLKEYKQKIELALGKERMEDQIRRAVFLISAGTNDFVNNYFTLPIRRKTFTVSAYQRFIITNVKEFIQNLLDEGARKIAIVGLPPMGCLPIVITLNANLALQPRQCVESYSSVAREYNLKLKDELGYLQKKLSHDVGAKIIYVDIYNPIADMIQRPHRFGFEEVSSGCCGTGYLEASFLCNVKSFVCPDASKYIFFDSVHPTEKVYDILFQANRRLIDAFLHDQL